MAETVLRQRKKRQDRWLHEARQRFTFDTIRQGLTLAAEAAPGFLLAFADVMGIPSGLHLAYLLALTAAERPLRRPLTGCVVAFLMRLLWGLSPRWELFLPLALLPLAPPIVGTRKPAAIMVAAAVAMIPAVVGGFMGVTASQALLALAAVPLCALSAPVMYRAVRALEGTRHIDSMEERVAVGFLAGVLLCGAARMMCIVNLGVLLSGLLTLLMAMYLGVGAGSIAGLMAGMALALQGLPLSLPVALAMGGFLAGMAQALGRRWITCAAFALGGALTLIVMQGAPLSGVALLAAAGAVALLPRSCCEQGQLFFRRFLLDQPAPGDAYASCALAAWEKTVDAMAMAVPSPADVEEERTPAWWEQKLCEGCPEMALCGCITSELGVRKAETVWACRNSPEDVWQGALEELRGLGCQRLYHLRQSMDCLRQEDAAAQLSIRRANDQREMLVTHLGAMAGAARRFAALSSGESWWDDMTARRIRKTLAETATPVRLSYVRRVQGHVQAAFELHYITSARRQAEELCRLVANLLDVPMRISRIDGDRVLLAESPLLMVEAGVVAVGIRDDGPCGDTAWTGLLQDGRFLAALSDGMGHGEKAALASRQTVELLRLCLDAGYTRAQTLTAVNGMMLLAGQGERFATVDLLTIDLWSGRAAIDKLGAAGSWLMQDGALTRITGDALPLGILESIESRAEHLQLHSGDTLILLTDGAEDAFADKSLLEDTIREALGSTESPEEAAQALLNAAIRMSPERRDDQTVAVLQIKR